MTTLKDIAKSALRPFANLLLKSTSILPERVGWILEERFQDGLLDAPNNKGVFIPIDPKATSHILLKKQFTSLDPDETGLPQPGRMMIGAPSLSSGKEDATNFRRLLFEDILPSGCRILDFGCGAGRLIRWFHDLSSDNEIWGVDLCEEYIKWLQQELSPPFLFAPCTSAPHLNFEDRSFDYIFAGSVFTHIYDLADAWLLELRRILKPGGRLLITVHDNESIQLLTEDAPVAGPAKKLKAFHEKTDVLNQDFAMFTISRRPRGAQVFHDRDYLRKHLSAYFNVLRIEGRQYSNLQTAVLLEKKAS